MIERAQTSQKEFMVHINSYLVSTELWVRYCATLVSCCLNAMDPSREATGCTTLSVTDRLVGSVGLCSALLEARARTSHCRPSWGRYITDDEMHRGFPLILSTRISGLHQR
jgi:hypothetical protein